MVPYHLKDLLKYFLIFLIFELHNTDLQLSSKTIRHSLQGDNPQIKVIVSFSPKKKLKPKIG